MKKNSNKTYSPGSFFLLNTEKFTKGKRKGEYKYIKLGTLEWKNNAIRPSFDTQLDTK